MYLMIRQKLLMLNYQIQSQIQNLKSKMLKTHDHRVRVWMIYDDGEQLICC